LVAKTDKKMLKNLEFNWDKATLSPKNHCITGLRRRKEGSNPWNQVSQLDTARPYPVNYPLHGATEMARVNPNQEMNEKHLLHNFSCNRTPKSPPESVDPARLGEGPYP
jgi:hypothetical protein